MTQTGSTLPPGRIEGLDALRGLAILLVMLRHAWPDSFGGAGIVGVVAFFALSGFLITGVLQRDIERYGRVRYRRFYLHRAIRLLPALLLLLVVFAAVETVWNLAGDRERVLTSVAKGLTYTMNIPGLPESSGLLNHLWTLATEEQFYLVWPLVLTVALSMRRVGAALVMTVLIVLATLVASLLVVAPKYETVYAWPATWAVAMVIGAAARLNYERLRSLTFTAPVVRRLAAIAGLVLLCALSLIPDLKSEWWAYLLLGPLISGSTIALILLVIDWRTLPNRALRPLLWLGIVSYAAYLWNKPLVDWFENLGLGPVGAALSIPATIAAAAASYFMVEAPANRLRSWIDRGSRHDFITTPGPAHS